MAHVLLLELVIVTQALQVQIVKTVHQIIMELLVPSIVKLLQRAMEKELVTQTETVIATLDIREPLAINVQQITSTILIVYFALEPRLVLDMEAVQL